MDEYKEPTSRRRISLFFPLLLITIGVVFLWQNLGGQKTGAWETLIKLWPLLLIYGGLEGIAFSQGTAVSTFWVTIGLALLLSNLGRITWSPWEIILSLWPVILVAFGVDMVFGKQTIWNRLLAGLIILAVVGGIVFFFDLGSAGQTALPEMIDQVYEDASRATIELEPTVGFLKVYAQGSPEVLVEGKVSLWQGEKLHQEYKVEDEVGRLTLDSSGILFLYEPGVANRASWDIGISSRIPVELRVNQAVGEMSLDLSELQLEGLDFNLAVGSTKVTLPRVGDFEGEISQAIGEFTIYVPEGVALRIDGRPAIGSLVVPEDFLQEGSIYTTPAFDESEPYIDLKIGLAVGQIVVRER